MGKIVFSSRGKNCLIDPEGMTDAHRSRALKMKIYHVIFILLGPLVLVLTGCDENQDDKVLLQIGKHELSVADYELLKSGSTYSQLPDNQLKEKLIEDGRIIAFALENRYDTIGVLKKQLEYTMRFYVSEVDGYLWNRRVKPKLTIAESTIRDAYDKRGRRYHFEVIKFFEEDALSRYALDSQSVISKSDFYSLKKNVVSEDGVKCYSYSSLYPFYPFGAYIDDLAQADVGDTFGPFQTQDGFFILHVASITSERPSQYDYVKSAIHQELSYVLKEKYIWESQQEIFRHTNPRISRAAIQELTSKVNNEKREWSGVDKNMVVMNYHLNGEDRKFTIEQFIEFAHYQPVFLGLLSNPEDVKKMVKTYLIT